MDKYLRSQKKILCISAMQNWGGGEEFLLSLSKNINSFEFIIASPEGNVLNKYKENSIKHIVINSLKKIYRDSAGWNIYSSGNIIFNIIISTFKLLRTIKAETPSIILANGLFAALYALPSVILSKKKLIVIQHLIFNEYSFEKKIIKIIHEYAARIVCVSNAVRENVLCMLKKTDSEKIIVIPNGFNVPGPETLRSKTNNEINIAVVGSIIRIKGIHLIIEALRDILKIHNVVLYIFGTTADNEDSLKYKKEIMYLIKNSGIEDKVHFEGYCESKEKIYTSSDIVINYSLIPEAFSFVVLESMAHKKIIIAAKAGGPKEIIHDGVNGFVVEPENEKLLKEKIYYCIKNFSSEEMNVIRNNARRTIEENYSIQKFAESYTALLDSLVSK